MALNVVGLFDNASDAQAAVRDLRAGGFTEDNISLVGSNASGGYGEVREGGIFDKDGNGLDAGEGASFGAVSGGLLGLLAGLGALAIPGIGPIVAGGVLASALAGTAIGAASGGIIGALVGAGIPESDANVYAEGVRRGGSTVMVHTDAEADAQRAVAILQQHNAVDIDRRAEEYRQAGWTGFDANANADYQGTSSTSLDTEGEVKIPVVEEELRVGKRTVESGGVQVRTYVQERPVNEQVTLRQENVEVHREAVNRPVTDADSAAFQEGTFEVRERSEQAVVDKQARVVEEVHVRKDVEERTENIQDTVRRTDVDVEQVPGTQQTSGYQTTGTTNVSGTGTDEGAIERNASRLGNAVERGLDADIDNDGDVGARDRRNNI